MADLEPIVEDFCGGELHHGERGEEVDAEYPLACLCGFPDYLLCPEFISGGIASMVDSTTPDVVLSSYLTQQQDGQEWALIDNLDADDIRDVAKRAITMLRDANGCIALAAVALDGMTERAMRFAARDAALACIGPYLDALALRFNGLRPEGAAPTQSDPRPSGRGQSAADDAIGVER